MLAILLGLGVWQVERLAWKTALIAEREARIAEPVVRLPADITDAVLDALEHRRVTLAGIFLHERTLYLTATRGGRAVFRLITPLARADGSTVLVDRGWIYAGKREPTARPASLVAGEVEVEGVLRGPGRKGWFTPDNDVARNYWFWLDLAAMARSAGVDAPALAVIAAPNPQGIPVGQELGVDIPNDHLRYAIIWFSLAVALVVIFVLSQRRQPQGDNA
jgi:surfeit locus 1 family protein